MTIKEMSNRFPFLEEGEVIYVCSNGVFFNKGTEAERRKRARHYCFANGLQEPERVEKKKKAAKPKKAAEENND